MHRSTRTRRRLAATALAATLVPALVACGSDAGPGDTSSGSPDGDAASTPAAAPAPAPTEASEAAADWLAGQLDGGLLSYESEYGPFTDVGMSIDAALALDAAGGHDEQVTAVADAVTGQLDTYVRFPSGQGTHVSAGPVAKAAVALQVAGGDPADAGGTDLVAELEELTGEDGRIADSFPRSNKKDADYANVIGQVYAVRALAAAGSSEAPAAQEQLLGQQCEDGGFRAAFAEPGSSCGDADADPDTTALAVVGLTALEEPDDAATTAADEAAAWLAGQQDGEGAVAGGQPAVANANTTGLAAWALGATGRSEEAGAATTWLEGVQVTDGPDAGAVAFDAAGVGQAADGVPDPARSQFLLATAQALPGLLDHSG